MSQQKTILVAPLDWGLGHATRCMPLINRLLQKKHRVLIAGNGDSFFLLKEQFPNLTFYELPGYNITYAVGKNASLHALLQTPKIMRTITNENKFIAELIKKESIDLIISDNRYGVRNKAVKSIFIGHQIALQAPKFFHFLNPIFLKLHLQQIHKFDALWIPDEADEHNLSGKLSHQINFKMPYCYIGIQSRFSNYQPTTSFISDWTIDILVVLSGPEPQRTFLEESLKRKLKSLSKKNVFIKGKTAEQKIETIGNITTINYLNANDLFVALQQAPIVICRSGYSTIMDLAVLGKKAILIPTPGQTEQEYLAEVLTAKGWAVTCLPDKLDILESLKTIENIKGLTTYSTSEKNLDEEIEKQIG